jgi:NAD(P)-dependent dehydrogenase (short-subunit alcohol dehydrogenase family)
VGYVVTGATGFVGRHLLLHLLKRKGDIYVLVRPGSRNKLQALLKQIDAPRGRIKPLEGDITKKRLGIKDADAKKLTGAELFHLAAVYDLEADEEANRLANVEGTRNVVAFANAARVARLHHVSTIVVAGNKWKGEFTEEMFDEGQELDQPYYQTKFEAEKIVRQEATVPFRIYRPGIVIGSSVTGEADRVDGPYYGFKLIQRLRDALPSWFPLAGLEGGPFNLVPVDYVAAAIDHIAHKPKLDGRTFHVVDPNPLTFGDTINEFCRAAHAPQFTLRLDPRAKGMIPKDVRGMLAGWPVVQTLKRQLLGGIHVPEAALVYVSNRTTFPATLAQDALKGSAITCPPLHSYAWKIWDYWERHLDQQAVTPRNLRTALEGRIVLVTGASSGIGRAVALECARHGAKVMLVSRTKDKLDELKGEIEKVGGRAYVYPTDLADMDACGRMLDRVLKEHGQVDILVNNAGRSIRRSMEHSYDRFHDYQRTMQLNYFGAVKLMLGVLPVMRERKSGHVINIASIGAQAYPPRFGAYVASKAALAGLSRCVGPEVSDDGVAITNVYMPLVRTPMIAPTGMYKNFPTISPEEAAEMVMGAILTRPPEVSTRLGKLGELVDVVSPGLLNLLMTAAYHAFPESAPTSGKDGRERKDGQRKEHKDGQEDQEISAEAAAMAFLMKGIHF